GWRYPLATVEVEHGRVSVEASIASHRADNYPDAVQHVEEWVRNLVTMPSPIAAIADPDPAAEFAAATARLVAEERTDHTVRVRVAQTGTDSHDVHAEIINKPTVAPQDLYFRGPLDSVPFVGDGPDSVDEIYRGDKTEVEAHWQRHLLNFGQTVDTVLGRA